MFCVLFLKPQSWCRLATSELRFDTVKDKCYVGKPDTIDALKDNIREAIGEIQLHTVDNVLKNLINRVGYCMKLKQPFEWNYFPLLTAMIILSNKKRNLRKYSVVFLKYFSKKKVFVGPYISLATSDNSESK